MFIWNKKTNTRLSTLEKELKALRCYVGELPHEWTAGNRYDNTPATFCGRCGKAAEAALKAERGAALILTKESDMEELNKQHHDRLAERFRQKELKQRRNVILTTIIIISLITGVLTIGFYWGN